MGVSSDSCHTAHPEQEAVVLAGSACEEDGAGGRRAAIAREHRLLQPAGPSAALQPWSCRSSYKSIAEMAVFQK